jgi:hypothetical protein
MKKRITIESVNVSRRIFPSRVIFHAGSLLASMCVVAWSLAPVCLWAQSQVPEGTSFRVELKDKLDAGRVHRGRHFSARTLEALETNDGELIPAGARVTGIVTDARKNQMQLRFDRIYTQWGDIPIVADVVGVEGGKGVKEKVGEEGEISSTGGGHVKHGLIGALIGGAAGAGIGAAADGGKGAEKGAAIGGGAGAVIGAVKGHKRLVLARGTRIRLELGAPLVLTARNEN